MARKLKVFRTPAGFHDAYVAAPSRKAALADWGADADLFARGVAEEVTDPALLEEPLARPGEVVRRSRGSAAEQLAAQGRDLVPPGDALRRAEGDGGGVPGDDDVGREELEEVADVVIPDVSHLAHVVEGGRLRVLGH